jgi:hypothetical protein
VAQLYQGSRQGAARRTRRPHVPCLNGGERLEGDIHQSALLLRQCTEPVMQMHRLIKERVLPLIRERSHGVGNGFIETAVQRAELICRNGRVLLDGQIRNGLANVTIVMDDLIAVYPRRRSSAPCMVAARPMSVSTGDGRGSLSIRTVVVCSVSSV